MLKQLLIIFCIIGTSFAQIQQGGYPNYYDSRIDDINFIQIDKNYYEASLDLIDVNGLIITDNVLWHGDVIDEKKNDRITLSIREFNSHVNSDKRTENLIIPVGDGLSVCRKL